MNFQVAKKKSHFKLKTRVGPFICSTRAIGQDSDVILRSMNFKHNFTCSYDPFGIVSKMRIKHKYTPYIHTSRPELEQFMNQEEWQENTL